MGEIKLNNDRRIGIDHPPFFIAEAGINHNGDIAIAKKLIDMASRVGVDAIKFQKRDYENTITSQLLKMEYHHMNSFGNSYLDHKRILEFSDEELLELADYSTQKNIFFSCSAFNIASYDFLEKEMSLPFHKIPSPLTINHDLLLHVASFGKPLLISTGMTSEKEIDLMMDVLEGYKSQIILLQCTSLYPTKNDEVNLNVLKTFQQKYNVITGLSSHDRSVVFPSAAVALGARVIEKHITLDRAMKGPDHASSFEERGLELSYGYCLDVYAAMGTNAKEVLPREKETRNKHMQSLVSTCTLEKGTVLDEIHLTCKSPGTGIPPYMKNEVLGKRTCTEIPDDTTIQLSDLE